MKIVKLKYAPSWLKAAEVYNENVIVEENGTVVWRDGVWHDGEWHDGEWRSGEWHGGVWRGGVWRGGVWHDGEWRDGEWHGGVWRGGVWRGGEWRDGEWRSGEWRGGVWRGGVWHDGEWRDGEWRDGEWRSGEWHGGVWRGGVWRGKENRLAYMAHLAGLYFDGSYWNAWRTTNKNCRGRHSSAWVQPEGEYFEDDLPASGSGTCIKGIHVTSAARAWTYFGIDPACQFWRVRFKPEDLLDCDGEKARIRGGTFTKAERPF